MIATSNPQTSSQRGFVFLCWGQNFIDEACASIASIRKVSPYPCTLFTCPESVVPQGVFDQIISLPLAMSYRDKILMRLSPYEETIFLDTDTHVFETFDDLFQALSRFDILYQATSGGFHYKLEGVPASVITEPSAGLIAWHRNERTQRFFDLWDQHYLAQERANGKHGAWDQRSMRAALYESDAHIFPIPKEWQVYGWETSVLLGKVKMVHGRDRFSKYAVANINRSNDSRLYFAKVGTVLPLREEKLGDYLTLIVAVIRRAARRAGRIALHRLGVWRLPVNKRPM